MSASVTSISTRINRPGPPGAVIDRAAGEGFAQVWAALRDAPARKPAQPRATFADEPVLVSAAAMNTAGVGIKPDRLTDALLAFKRHSTITFTHAVAASAYAADPAERGAPAASGLANPRGLGA
jgi:hypothetical protein